MATKESRLQARTDKRDTTEEERGIVSGFEWREPRIRRTLSTVHGALLALLVLVGLGPLLWLIKSAITPTQDTLRTPMSIFPHGIAFANISTAWSEVHIDVQFANSVWIALGCWAVEIVVATTAAFAIAILRPKYAGFLNGMVLTTLFVPVVVLLVPLYLVVINPPLVHHSMINTFWAVWLPAGANAFNVVLLTRFMQGLPRELFEAARLDGAGPFRLFWSLALPMSKPILGVVSIFAAIGAWKDYLWPMLVLSDPAMQPLSVRLPTLQHAIELDVFLAALAISTVIPVVLFLVFQRLILRGAGLGGAIKG